MSKINPKKSTLSARATQNKPNPKKLAKYQQALASAAHHIKLQQYGPAEVILMSLLDLSPSHIDAHLALIQLYIQTNRQAKALILIKQQLLAWPTQVTFIKNLALISAQCKDFVLALECWQLALSIKPDCVEYLLQLGQTFNELNQHHSAIDCYNKAAILSPSDYFPLLQLGISQKNAHLIDAALVNLLQAQQLQPSNASIYRYLGLVYLDLGEIENAALCWRRVLSFEPNTALPYLHLSKLGVSYINHADISVMEDLLEETSDNQEKIFLAFALGKSFEDANNYTRAFYYWNIGNQLKRKEFNYDLTVWAPHFSQLASTFSADFFKTHNKSANDGSKLIFIIGMPRSGTSLVEQILASHPRVFGAGELTFFPTECAKLAEQEKRPFPDFFQTIDPSALQAIGKAYLEGIYSIAPNSDYITDKLPHNFRYLGLISANFPNAKIIHCQRGAVDTCFSLYKNLFGSGNSFSYDLKELGVFYRLYQQLMAHWHKVLPNKIYDISYEQLVSNPAQEIKLLLDYCGLDFDDRCIDFHKTNRAVNTASSAQVRQPMYTNSVDTSINVADYLTDLGEFT